VARFVNGVAAASVVWHLSRPSITRQSPPALCTAPIKVTLIGSLEMPKDDIWLVTAILSGLIE